MGIDPVSSAQSGIGNLGQAIRREKGIRDTAEPPQDDEETPAAIYEKTVPEDRTVLTTYGRYSGSANTVPAREAAKHAGLSRLIESLFGLQAAQGGKSGSQVSASASQQNSDAASTETRGQAEDATEYRQVISEDGYWGVTQTSQRIIKLVISLSGGDTFKLETLKGAIQKGFEGAEHSWGKALPGICRQTMDTALDGLDEWAGTAAPETGET